METLIASLDDKKQITRVPIDPSYPVNTAWDLGYNDQTAIIFFSKLVIKYILLITTKTKMRLFLTMLR